MFELSISTDGAAFHDSGETARADELARILRSVAESVEGGLTEGRVRDVNGNGCGRWSITQGEG